MGTGLDTDEEMEVASLPKVGSTTMEKFLDKFEGTEKEMTSLFILWDTTTALDYKNLERKTNQTTWESFKKGTTQATWFNL